MAIETTPWDAADFLRDDAAVAAYLEAALEDGEPNVIAAALGNIARVKGMTAIANQSGGTREALYKSLSDKGDPKLSTLLGVMKALGLRFAVLPADRAA